MSNKHAKRKTGRSKGARRSLLRRLGWKRSILVGALALVLGFIAFVGIVYAFARIPEPTSLSRAQSILVVDRSGRPIGRIHSEADRVSIPLEQMPKVLRDAVIATEDRDFYHHRGIRPQSIVRAALANLFGGHQGGSTITQQYVKNAFVGSRRTISRKVIEAVLALKLERQRSKDKILTDYLNTIYFGRGAFGCESAAQTYFSVHARDLTLTQAAFLAGVIRSPSLLDPARAPDAARARRDQVLGFMVRDRYLTQERADVEIRRPLVVRAKSSSGVAPHYLEDVRRFVEEQLGAQAYSTLGVVVHATLDKDMQIAANEAVTSVYDKGSDPQAALVAIDPKTGFVRAMVGSRSYAQLQLNVATQARRQPGSTFKVPVLSEYVAQGNSIDDIYDAPASIETGPGGPRVSNYDRSSHGKLSVEQATWDSVNTVFIQLIKKIGATKVAARAHEMGIVSKLDPVIGLTLGVSGVTPLELTDLYATLAARGEQRDPVLVRSITASDGKVLYRIPAIKMHPALDRRTADVVNQVLQGVIENGTGHRANIGRPAAGKTGTTENFRDAWFAGYTPDLATVVWNGYPEPDRLLRNVRGINVTGGSFPAEMWARFMKRALQSTPPTPFQKPAPGPSPTPTASPSPSSTPSPSPSAPVSPTPSISVVPTHTPGPKPSKSSSPSPSPSPSPSASPSASP